MNQAGIPIDKISSIEWMLVPLLIVLVSYAIIRHMQVGVITNAFRQCFSFSLSNQDYKGAHGLSSRLSIALVFNSVIIISIFSLILSMYTFSSIKMPFIEKYIDISFLIISFRRLSEGFDPLDNDRYKSDNRTFCSDGLIGIRLSAFDPVKERFVSI